MSQVSRDLPTTPAGPAPIGFVAALPWEVGPWLRKQGKVSRAGECYSFVCRGGPVMLVVAGMGARNSFRAARALLDGCSPRALVTLGFAGALRESLLPGDVFLAEKVFDQQTGETFDCRGDFLPLTGVERGNLLSAGQVVASAEAKRRLAERWGAAAVDMESAGVARAAAQAQVPFCAIKSITDASGESIFIDFERCRSEHGELVLRKVFWEAIRTPHGIRELWALAWRARRAARNLALVLGAAG